MVCAIGEDHEQDRRDQQVGVHEGSFDGCLLEHARARRGFVGETLVEAGTRGGGVVRAGARIAQRVGNRAGPAPLQPSEEIDRSRVGRDQDVARQLADALDRDARSSRQPRRYT